MNARIISITNPKPSASTGVMPESCEHSKFIKRKQYVENILKPQINSLGINTEIFQAITPFDITKTDNVYTYKDITLINPAGVIGCTFSHAMLWKLCISSNSPILILEDDALLPKSHENNVIDAIREYEKMPDTCDLLYLQGQVPYLRVGLHNYPKESLKPFGKLYKASPVNDMSGTAAYAIKPLGAQKLLSNLNKVETRAVDGYIHDNVNRSMLDVVIPSDFNHVFMLNEHFADWNHIHTPETR
jgi:GR25 family glycosyltransferase involved in LPS biosynthesis